MTGCGTFGEKEDETAEWGPEQLYFAAKDRLDGADYSGAVEYYEILQGRFPFGVYAQQAQLELAYAYHKSDEPASALAALDRFATLYPNHPSSDYAQYLRGLVNFNVGKGVAQRYLPTDPSQRDQGSAMESFEEFQDLIKRYPDSEYVDDARQRMVYLRNLLAQHEVHVANYYMRREAYVAAANRARYVVENFQQTPAVPEALTIMAHAYKVMGLAELSDDALRVLEMNHPNHPGIFRVREIVVR